MLPPTGLRSPPEARCALCHSHRQTYAGQVPPPPPCRGGAPVLCKAPPLQLAGRHTQPGQEGAEPSPRDCRSRRPPSRAHPDTHAIGAGASEQRRASVRTGVRVPTSARPQQEGRAPAPPVGTGRCGGGERAAPGLGPPQPAPTGGGARATITGKAKAAVSLLGKYLQKPQEVAGWRAGRGQPRAQAPSSRTRGGPGPRPVCPLPPGEHADCARAAPPSRV